ALKPRLTRAPAFSYTAAYGRSQSGLHLAPLHTRAGRYVRGRSTITRGGVCMIHHVWGLFTHPDQEWQEIRGEEESISHMYLTHVLLLAAIPAICAYFGTTEVGWRIGSGEAVKLTATSALQMTIMSYLAMLAGVAVMGAFIHWMARTYDSNPTLTQCIVFAAYTATPLFIGG